MNILHIPDVGFHFIWKRDFVSVICYGILSHYLFFRLGMKHPGERIFKAQRQAGIDLISIWDPWAFLKRHWKNMPLGSDNQPWLVIDSSIEGYFRDVNESGASDNQFIETAVSNGIRVYLTDGTSFV